MEAGAVKGSAQERGGGRFDFVLFRHGRCNDGHTRSIVMYLSLQNILNSGWVHRVPLGGWHHRRGCSVITITPVVIAGHSFIRRHSDLISID